MKVNRTLNNELSVYWCFLLVLNFGVQMRNAGDGKTAVDWTYTVDPVPNQTRAELTSFMTSFYSYNLSILQTAANASTTAYQESTGKQEERQVSVKAAGCKPLSAMLWPGKHYCQSPKLWMQRNWMWSTCSQSWTTQLWRLFWQPPPAPPSLLWGQRGPLKVHLLHPTV